MKECLIPKLFFEPDPKSLIQEKAPFYPKVMQQYIQPTKYRLLLSTHLHSRSLMGLCTILLLHIQFFLILRTQILWQVQNRKFLADSFCSVFK